jgi:hypothetical protein
MGTLYNPSIVRDGLVLHLDAANVKSYPGSGSTWFDMSGNGNNGVITGSVPYSSLFGGVLNTPGTTGNYINVSLNLTSVNHTVMVSSRYADSSQNGRVLSGLSNNWLLGHHSTGNTRGDYFANGWVYLPSNTGGDVWGIYTGTGNISTDTWEAYDNAVLKASNTAGSQGPNGLSIGRYGAGNSEYSNAYVGFVMCYDRVLSSIEIQQNYNAMKGRYGL